ncbi:MAG: sensor domain-containing diguanylate cyclase, partial [Campylobacter sp.]|nr:sensor domain-containing diguanylate cyclase [Campylobacter sp.]
MRTNKAFSDITGYNEEEVLGRYPSFLFAKNKEESVQALRNSLTKDDVYRDEIEGLSKKGEIIPAIVTINAIRDDKSEITNYMIMFMEIYGIKEREEKLQLIAHYDALTNLPNRIYFMQIAPEFMQKAKDSGKFMAVLFIDYDGFKAINDTYGHDVGDIYLREISAVMKRTLREDDFLARLGGDEFCAIIPNIEDKSSLTPILNRLLEASNTKFNITNEKIGASASIGVVFYNGDEEVEFKDLLSRADKAMYNAKTLHKGGFSIYEDMSANSQVDRLIASIKN